MPKKLTQEEFINKCIEIHGDKYDYSDTIYINANTKATFICKKHGKFEQRAYWHLITGGCVKCVQDKMCDKYRVDGYDPNTNTIYEFNGDFWHGNPNRFDSNELNRVSKLTFGELYQKTLDKENKLKELGYNVISIWETDFLNEQVLS